MLNTFESHAEIKEIPIICDKLRSLKKRIYEGDYKNPFGELESCKKLFKYVKEIAIKNNDEKLANAQAIYNCYFRFFAKFANYHQSLLDEKYKDSWFYLQDCFDLARVVGKFVAQDKRREIPQIVDILRQYEKMYPYNDNWFWSSEFVVLKSRCSICGKSMQSFECTHRKGNLYWGDFAVENIYKADLKSVSLVDHPRDKRRFTETKEQSELPEKERFNKLDAFLRLRVNPLQYFDMRTKTEFRRNHRIKKMNRNDVCFCGSGKKFKKCCSNKLYGDYGIAKISL